MAVKQAENVLELIEYFARRKDTATLSEIANDLSWPRSSTFNILETLINCGYIYAPRDRYGYYPTPKLQQLANEIAEAPIIPEGVCDLVRILAAETGETVSLAAPAGMNVAFIHVVESEAAIRYSAHVGKLLPIHATAAGRAILSQYSASARDALLAKIAYGKSRSAVSASAEAVREEIERSEQRGWFQSNAEFTPDVCGLALKLPVDGRILAIAIGGPIFRLEPKLPATARMAHDRIVTFLDTAAAR